MCILGEKEACQGAKEDGVGTSALQVLYLLTPDFLFYREGVGRLHKSQSIVTTEHGIVTIAFAQGPLHCCQGPIYFLAHDTDISELTASDQLTQSRLENSLAGPV